MDKRGKRRYGPKRYVPKPKVCYFCVNGINFIDYKEVMMLRRFISDRARIEPDQRTGTCASHQRLLGTALKRARFLALLPYTPGHIRGSGGAGPRE